MMGVMDQKIIGYGRGGAVGVFLGNVAFMVFNGENPRSILVRAAMYAVIGVCIVLLIERGLKRWGARQPTQP